MVRLHYPWHGLLTLLYEPSLISPVLVPSGALFPRTVSSFPGIDCVSISLPNLYSVLSLRKIQSHCSVEKGSSQKAPLPLLQEGGELLRAEQSLLQVFKSSIALIRDPYSDNQLSLRSLTPDPAWLKIPVGIIGNKGPRHAAPLMTPVLTVHSDKAQRSVLRKPPDIPRPSSFCPMLI
jgi:hypothetical protein